jgi:uncharacterized protein
MRQLAVAPALDHDDVGPHLTRLTPTLRALINQHRSSAAPEAFAEFIAQLGVLASAVHEQLTAFSPGIKRAWMLHRLMGQAMKDVGPDAPSCRAGCGSCCHLEVEITRDEGELLARRVKEGLAIDELKLKAQASRARLDPAWRRMAVPENRCVFLGEDGNCRVYEDRPASCRKLLVVSAPSECGTPSGDVKPITIPMAELVLSTMLSLPDTDVMSLSKAVRAAL